MHHILENVEPELAGRLRNIHPAQSCQVLIKACDFVRARISLEVELETLLKDCHSPKSFSSSKRQALGSYAEIADECCFDLKDGGANENEWFPWFQRARLATAFAKISETPTWEDMADGLYELTVIFDDTSVIVEFIKQRLLELQA